MSRNIIDMNGVDLSYTTKYQTVNVLKKFDMSVLEGEYLVIMGASGCGKSSILNVIAGFIKPQDGKVCVSGNEISNLSDEELSIYRNQTIGYIFQSFNLIYKFTVIENVMAPLLISGMNKKEAEKIAEKKLKDVQLEHRLNHFPNELSGGEQQRVGIARALANNPDIILADEPTGNLDKEMGKIILDIFDKIHNSGKTIILVTHDESIRCRATRVVDL